MTDKELLELSATAAGFICKWNADSLLIEDGAWHEWNPLTDDGDALRLAVKLGLHIDIQLSGWVEITLRQGCEDVLEPIMNDPYAATRRAIVRAAAEIGKNVDSR